MSEPMRNHDFERLAWATFSNENDCQQAEFQISQIRVDDYGLQAVRSFPNRKRTPVRITPPLPKSLVEIDLELCKQLITDVLDPERGIETFIVDFVEKLAKPAGAEEPSNEQKPDDQGEAAVLVKQDDQIESTELKKSLSEPLPNQDPEESAKAKTYLTTEQ